MVLILKTSVRFTRTPEWQKGQDEAEQFLPAAYEPTGTPPTPTPILGRARSSAAPALRQEHSCRPERGGFPSHKLHTLRSGEGSGAGGTWREVQ